MPKGLSRMISAALLMAASTSLSAQVYRCESPSGITFSDMPCSDSAEQIEVSGDVMDSRGVGSSTSAAVADGSGELDSSLDSEGQTPPEFQDSPQGNIQQFVATLEAQREQQLAQVDRQLSQLRQEAGSDVFASFDPEYQNDVLNRIETLESARINITEEYAALIAEANRRLD